ncbi:MAG: hypothetical protein Q9183_007722, partial [Haloplaca sp. 2 TL-2023]
MFQCLGLAGEDKGGCGEDWWHPECVLGLGRDWTPEEKNKSTEAQPDQPVDDDSDNLPPGFPKEDDFETFICYKCVDANPWIKRYAASTGFLAPVIKAGGRSSEEEGQRLLNWADEYHEAGERTTDELRASRVDGKIESSSNQELVEKPSQEDSGTSTTGHMPIPQRTDSNQSSTSLKRRAEDDIDEESQPPDQNKKPRLENTQNCYYDTLPKASNEPFSLFLKEDFRDHFCRCAKCFPDLCKHPQLLEEEESYEPPVSEDGGEDGRGSVGTGSLLDR